MRTLVEILDKHLSSFSFSKLAVGVSGGPDSLCLTLALKQWCDSHGIHLVALTVDHGLRAESTEEAQKVKSWLEEQKIEHHILTWNHGVIDSHVQEQARQARYDLMTNFCKQHDIAALCIGHHLQDQLETFLMRLFKGSGLEGLSAMKVKSTWNNTLILRPFLTTKKERLLQILRDLDQDFLIDPSNTDLKFERIRWRKMELSEQNLDGLAQAITKIQHVNHFIEESLEDAWMDCVTDNELSIPHFLQLHTCVATRLLSRLLQQVSGKPYPASYESLVNIVDSLQHGEYKNTTAGGCILSQHKNKLLITIDERIKKSA